MISHNSYVMDQILIEVPVNKVTNVGNVNVISGNKENICIGLNFCVRAKGTQPKAIRSISSSSQTSCIFLKHYAVIQEF